MPFIVSVGSALSGIAFQTGLDPGQMAGTTQAYGNQMAEVEATAGLTRFSPEAVGSGPEAARSPCIRYIIFLEGRRRTLGHFLPRGGGDRGFNFISGSVRADLEERHGSTGQS
ncbi:hypothetical protein BDV24DRAFT_167596 [Aspergillus arachidicola]|uniref:Uncharacterized protein n=1 Tax=Aspergillus arachidicola TaxID=656916 RepID=A0A5N6XVL1_9EURO|nr:hypothetical protein BDV24DRAFT_167596 [Aspergillus arachidicola]